MCVRRKSKLDPQYVGSLEILERDEPVSNRLALLPELEKIHDVFYVSQLCKYISDPNHIITYPPLQLQEDLSYVEEPAQILDHKMKQVRTKKIPLVKVI